MIDSNGKTSSATIKTVMSWLLVFVLTVSSVLPANADIFGVLYALSKRVITAAGTEYEVSVITSLGCGIPLDAELNVREIEKGSDEYNNYLKSAEEKIGGRITDAGFLDIEIVSGGEKIEPKAPVKVEIKRLDDKPVLGDELVLSDELTLTENLVGEDLVKEDLVKEDLVVDDLVEESMAHILHFEDDNSIIQIDVEETDNVFTFEASSFSVYAIIYTVDFSYNGYEISIKGGSSILLSSLCRILGVDGFNVADVESVRFSNENLLSLAKAGSPVSGTVILNGEEIEVNDIAEDGDWVVRSLQAFDTEETLTVVMKDGRIITITVRDEILIQDPDDQTKQIVQTIANPAGTKIDLFDYWIEDSSTTGRSAWPGFGTTDGTTGLNGTGNNKGINKKPDDSTNHGHALKFSPANEGTVFNGSLDNWSNPNSDGNPGLNNYTKNADPNTGIVENILVDGYPKLKNDNDRNVGEAKKGTDGESLAYLFNSDVTTQEGKAYYPGVNNLLYVDKDGYYTYDSREYAAKYKDGNFKLTKQTSTNTEVRGFWPFETQQYWSGMHMSTEFSMPENGQVLNPQGENKDMQFEFSGDDDTWLYIDGVLVGDGGGIHNRTEIDINFATGKVLVTGTKDQYHPGSYNDTKYLYELLKDKPGFNQNDWEPIPGDEGHKRFKSGTSHTFDMFYLERGGGESNLYIHYNLVSTYDFTGHKSLTNYPPDPLAKNQFKFELIGFDGKYAENGTVIDATARAIMPKKGTETGEGTVDSPLKEYNAEENYTSLIMGNSEDGNINFGNIEEGSGTIADGDTYRYMLREIIPEGAADNITYDPQTYYFTGTYTWNNGRYDLKKTRYTDSSYSEEDNGTKFFSFTNTYNPDLGNVSFTKKDGHGNNLPGVTFKLYNDEACSDPALNLDSEEEVKPQWEDTSKADGSVSFTNVRVGTYYMREEAVPQGYELDPSVYKVEIKKDSPSTITVNGTEITEIKNYKTDEINVEKLWTNYEGQTIDPGADSVTVRLKQKKFDTSKEYTLTVVINSSAGKKQESIVITGSKVNVGWNDNRQFSYDSKRIKSIVCDPETVKYKSTTGGGGSQPQFEISNITGDTTVTFTYDTEEDALKTDQFKDEINNNPIVMEEINPLGIKDTYIDNQEFVVDTHVQLSSNNGWKATWKLVVRTVNNVKYRSYYIPAL